MPHAFTALLEQLRLAARREIQRGRFTERSLARRAGLSQPHVHNVLDGARRMSPEAADRLLDALGLSLDALTGPPRDTSRAPDGPSAPN